MWCYSALLPTFIFVRATYLPILTRPYTYDTLIHSRRRQDALGLDPKEFPTLNFASEGHLDTAGNLSVVCA